MKYTRKMIKKAINQINEIGESRLIRICEENDFIVGNIILKHELEKVLPDKAEIFVDSRVEPTKIHVIRKLHLIKIPEV